MWSSLRDNPAKIFFIPLFLTLFIVGCATYNAATERSEFIFISTPQEVSMGNSIHQDLVKEYKLVNDVLLVSRVQKVGQRLAQVSDRQDFVYKYFVVDKDELNAFTTPGGNIYIFSGLLKKFKTDDELAFVLAHEIGHSAAKHTVKKFQAAMGYQLMGDILVSQVTEGAQRITQMTSQAVMHLVFSAYGRQDEYQADRLGLKYMYLAGYDMQGSIGALTLLKDETKDTGSVPLILRTHPFLDDRIKMVGAEIENVKIKFSKSAVSR